MIKVAIYPGHVGKDAGGIDGTDVYAGDELHTIEAVVTWGIADKVAGMLAHMGIDHSIGIGSFENRICDTRDCTAGVSIHADVFPTQEASGYHVIHYPRSRDGIRLAAALDESMSVVAHRHRAPWCRANLAILRDTAFPVALVECGFLSNPEEEAAMLLRSRQYRLAWGIVDGVMRYLFDGKGW